MHTGFVISADIIAEETRNYIHENNLPMDVDNPWITRQWLLKHYVIDVIEKHVGNDIRYETDNDHAYLVKPLHPDVAFGLSKDNLVDYTENQITFDNIIPLVHAMFKDNWEIEVEVAQKTQDPNLWYITHVTFVPEDQTK